MQHLFDIDKVEKWANFSGDYNPIHFDPEAAAGIGESGVVAHGMLVLMAAKQALTDRATDEQGWVQVRSWFRRPVSQTRPVTVGIESREQKMRFVIGDPTDDKALIEGTFAPIARPSVDCPSEARDLGSAFDRTELAERWEYFEGSFPSITASWIFIDALVFSAFIENHVDALLKATIDGNDALHHVVQISQQVGFDFPALQRLSYGRDVDLAYRYRQAEWLRDDTRTAGSIHLTALLDGRPVLTSKIGLLATQGVLPATAPRAHDLHLTRKEPMQ